jgi:hypothetical protein
MVLSYSLHKENSMKRSIYWDITACNPVKVKGHNASIFRPENASKTPASSMWQAEWFLASLTFQP